MIDIYDWKLKHYKIIIDILNKIKRNCRLLSRDVNYVFERLAIKVYNSYQLERFKSNGKMRQDHEESIHREWNLHG